MIPAVDLLGELERSLREVLPKNYQGITFFSQGGTRRIYVSNWGHGDEKRIIKVDINPESPRAIRHVSRGCNTANDLLRLTQIPDPESHNINGVVDYYETEGLTVSVERFFEGQSLEELVEKKPLSVPRFEKVFSQIISTERYLIKEANLYHRDLKPSNVLVGEDDQVRIIDFANACSTDQPEEKVLPTAGGHWIVDPLILSQFTGKETAYNERSEIYALGADMFYSLTGKYVFEFDPDEETARVCATGESLLDDRNILDRERYHSALEEALQTLPRKAKKYSPVIRKCLSLNGIIPYASEKDIRYDSIDELAEDFHLRRKHDNKFFAKFAGSKNAFIGASVFLALSLGTIFGADYVQKKQKLEAKLVESEKYLIAAEWSDAKLEVLNNFFEMDARVNIYKRAKEGFSSFPSDDYIVAAAGDELHTTLMLRELARPRAKEEMIGVSNLRIKGRIYIEGYENKEEFYLYTSSLDGDEFYDQGADSCVSYGKLIVPKLEEGIYTLVFEAYAPTEENIKKSHSTNMKQLRLANPGSILARKRVPIVVGNPRAKVFTTNAYHGLSNGVTMSNLLGEMEILPEGLEVESQIVNEGYFHKTNCGRLNVCSARIYGRFYHNELGRNILQVAAYDGGQLIHYAFLPVFTERLGGDNNLHITESAIPPNDFQDQLVKLRKKLENKSR